MTALADIDLVLASSSPYRRSLLARIATRFRTVSPQVDEQARPAEKPIMLAARLAAAKAAAAAQSCPGAVIIGSDQVAELDGQVLGKPGSESGARTQLAACSGREVWFHTAVCVLDGRCAPAETRQALDTTRVLFRQLDEGEIVRYVAREQPLDCAGSFKCEGLGIALFETIDCSDPTALVGLPLISLCRLLREASIALLY